jgi:diaminohydroxyphosphoribosylaminopyrimidine deaminase/5-amino-6-(5-phosphoribosylamino)uracil reductase
MDMHEVHMQLALDLAERGWGYVEPNPMVGAVLVREGQVIGQGWHAEVEAIADARAAGHEVAGSTLYVSLEPCCHTGKTPPCTKAIVEAKIATVVAAVTDPFEKVRGKGLAQLRQAGIEVITDICPEPARRLLRAYLKLRTLGRPWVICKWAQTLDGRIATRTGHSRWISSEASRQRVHRIRGGCDGVAVGVKTVLADDPMLTNRSGAGRQPTRVVLDDMLGTPLSSRLVASADKTPLLMATTINAAAQAAAQVQALRGRGIEVLELPAGPGGIDLAALLDELGRRQWTRLLIEGGATVLGSFIGQNLADELNVFIAPRLLGGREGLPCIQWPEADRIDQAKQLGPPEVERIEDDLLMTFTLSQN